MHNHLLLEDGPRTYNIIMPSRNLLKQYDDKQYYHIYTRGVAKQDIFLDEEDFIVFLSLFKRYLSIDQQLSLSRVPYPHYYGRLELIAFCLMSNHIHLFVYQQDSRAVPEFMKSILTSYSMYFNKKYKRVGPVFQSRFLASHVFTDTYFEHITRYIHLNPRNWAKYEYSSLSYYMGKKRAEWVKPDRVISIFNNKDEYLKFLEDYEDYKDKLDELKWELAHL